MNVNLDDCINEAVKTVALIEFRHHQKFESLIQKIK